MAYINNKKLYYQQFLNREGNIRHHKYDEELELYALMKAGDMRAVTKGKKMFTSSLVGHVSNDRLLNFKYLFVASVTLATRFAIEGGLDEELAYTSSDLYIQQLDQCKTVEEVNDVFEEMLTFFTQKMAALKKKNIYSKPILLCIDYIYDHLHEKLSVDILAEVVNLNPNYLSGLFKKETGRTILTYICDLRIEAAKNLLLYSDASFAEIASMLSFNSQSYFIKVFRENTSLTPKEYRKKFFRADFERSEKFQRTHDRIQAPGE